MAVRDRSLADSLNSLLWGLGCRYKAVAGLKKNRQTAITCLSDGHQCVLQTLDFFFWLVLVAAAEMSGESAGPRSQRHPQLTGWGDPLMSRREEDAQDNGTRGQVVKNSRLRSVESVELVLVMGERG